MACVQYGERVDKTIKTFEATWRPAGGRIRVVIVWEDEAAIRESFFLVFCAHFPAERRM